MFSRTKVNISDNFLYLTVYKLHKSRGIFKYDPPPPVVFYTSQVYVE